MEMLTYLLKSAGILTVFYLVYRSLLSKETFYAHNRVFLLAGILVAAILPSFWLTTVVFVEPQPLYTEIIPTETFARSAPVENAFDFWQLGLMIYAVGVLVMSGLFAKELWEVYRFLHHKPRERHNGFTHVKVENLDAPFSFFGYIAYDPCAHAPTELQAIIAHEEAHARQKHTIDVLLAQMARVLLWFHPLSWFYLKAVSQNHEFLADQAAVQHLNNRKHYQYTLVKTGLITRKPQLVHTFYQSFIKKRIVMLNSNQSRAFKKWKLYAVVPFVAVFLLAFNTKEEVKYLENKIVSQQENAVQSEAEMEKQAFTAAEGFSESPSLTKREAEKVDAKSSEALHTKQEVARTTTSHESNNKGNTPTLTENPQQSDYYSLSPNASKDQIDAIAQNILLEHGVTLKIKKLKYNTDGLISDLGLKLENPMAKSTSSYSASDSEGIAGVTIIAKADGTIGFNSINREERVVVGYGKTEKAAQQLRQEAAQLKRAQRQVDRARVNMDSLRKERVLLRTQKLEERTATMEASRAELEETRLELAKVRDSLSQLRSKTKTQITRNEDGSLKEVVVTGYGSSIFKSDFDKEEKKPLFILDGEEVERLELKTIEPDEIESVTVLKNKEATSLYGEKAKNGVVLIVTKKD